MMLLFLLQVAAAAGQPNAEAARVDSLFSQWNKPRSPGCALGVVRDGKFIYQRGYGVQNPATGVPLSTRSVFYAASVSKQFAAASVLLAARDGKLSLDDEVRRWIPELPATAPRISVAQLIHHISGLRDYLTLWSLAGKLGAPHSDADLIGLLARQRALNFDPGTEFSYSNSGYVLLSFILHRATGKTLREFAQERIFGPLGMRNTHFHDDRTERHDPRTQAVGYYPAEPPAKLRSGLLPEFDKVGDGGLYTTVEDLAKWDQNFYSGKVGGPDFPAALLQRGVLASGDTINYAFALVVDQYKRLKSVEHSGTFMGYRNEFLRLPDQRFSVICLCNLGTIDPAILARRVADIHLESEFAGRLAPFAGDYGSDELGLELRVGVRGGDLYLERGGQPAVRLTPVVPEYGAKIKEEKDRFTFDSGLGDMTVTFLSDGQARVSALTVDAGRARNLRFVAVRR